MDIIVRTQATADINIIIPLAINTGAPDTGATVTVKAINPDGTENTSFTTPTISEVIASSGVYKLVFSASAANKLFVLADENNPYTVLVKSATSGSTQYRALRVYCTSKMQGELSKTSEITTLSGVVALDATVAKAATVALDSTVAKASAVTTLQTDMTFIKKVTKNRKTLSASGSVYSLNVFDDDDTTPIMTKVLKDVTGADVATPATGVIAKELKSSV